MDIGWTWVCDRSIDLYSAKNDFCFSTTKTHGIYVLVSFVVCIVLFLFFLLLGGQGQGPIFSLPLSSLPLTLSLLIYSCYERDHVEEPKVMHCIGRSRVHFTKHYTAGQCWKTVVHRKKKKKEEIWAVSPMDFVERNKDEEMNSSQAQAESVCESWICVCACDYDWYGWWRVCIIERSAEELEECVAIIQTHQECSACFW